MDSVGSYLQQERELRGISLDEVADATRIPLHQLTRLEQGRFSELPGDVFVKGYIRAYARVVGVKGDDVVRRYTDSTRELAQPEMVSRLSQPVPERGKRFGLAIALVVFAILATLAMSFLLRPRTQDRSEQLSRVDGTHLLTTLTQRACTA